MNEQQKRKVSTFMSLVLRHKPEEIGLQLDENGWALVSDLIYKMNGKGHALDFENLEEIVATNDKKRFAFNDDKTKIRASQGHSVAIDLALIESTPPETLFHGTVEKFIVEIKTNGLLKMSRQHVHLSKDKETAIKVGSRRGNPILLIVNSIKMHEDGYRFYQSENGVWLTDHVPAKYIQFQS